MKTHKSLIVAGIVALATLVALTLVAGLTQAQGPGPGGNVQPQGEAGVAATAPGAIPIQGRLTDNSGSPLNGVYTLTYRLYDAEGATTSLCSYTKAVTVTNGLFSSYIDNCYDKIWGQKLWLGIQVAGDLEEMQPRQVIYPVPYALSLVPGAVISTAGYPALHVESTSPSGRGLRAYASATSGTNYGVVGASSSPNGYGGYFYDDANGIGLYGRGNPGVLGENGGFGNGIVGRAGALGAGVKGEGNALAFGGLFTNTMGGTALRAESDGTALQLGGSGRIESTADSYIFVPGSALVKEQEDNALRWTMQANGAALLWRGATAGNQYVHIPIILPSVLYGQSVTVKSVTIYYQCGNGSNNYITATDLHKQTDADSFVVLVSETTDRTSNTAASYTLTPTSDNVLSSSQGILMLRLYLNFANDTDSIRIGGVRVQLGH